eukprot:151669-Pyramimonas_sp.AAC.1
MQTGRPEFPGPPPQPRLIVSGRVKEHNRRGERKVGEKGQGAGARKGGSKRHRAPLAAWLFINLFACLFPRASLFLSVSLSPHPSTAPPRPSTTIPCLPSPAFAPPSVLLSVG